MSIIFGLQEFCMKKSQFKRQILFIKDVEQITGLNKVTIRRWWKSGHFPAPEKLNDSVLIWHYDDIHQWINDKTKRSFHPPV